MSIVFRQENLGFRQDILQSLSETDLLIQSGTAVVRSSVLLFALSSRYMAGLFDGVLSGRSRLDDESVVLFLPDFSAGQVSAVVRCLRTGSSPAGSKEELAKMESLLELLGVQPAISGRSAVG